MALGSTQPLAEMSTGMTVGGSGRPALKTDNHTAICEPIIYKMWEPPHLTTLWVPRASYRDSFTLPFTNGCRSLTLRSKRERLTHDLKRRVWVNCVRRKITRYCAS
jgi:hypothetical protein